MCPRVLSGGNKLSEEIRAPGFDPDTMPNSTYRVRKVSAEAIENSYEAATSTLKLRNSSMQTNLEKKISNVDVLIENKKLDRDSTKES